MPHVPLPDSQPPRPPEDRRLEPAPRDAVVRLSLLLKATAERNADDITKQQKTIADYREHWQKARPRDRAYLSAEAFAKEFGSPERTLARVHEFAGEYGLSVENSIPAMRHVVVAGRVSDVERAFLVELLCHRLHDQIYCWHEGPVHVPEGLQDVVEAVIGLHTEPLDPFARPARDVVAGGVDPRVLACAYDFPTGSATGECIAVILLGGGFDPADLTHYFTGLGLSVPTITVVELAGQTNSPVPAAKIEGMLDGTVPPDPATLWTVEASLDVQLIGTLAHGAHIVVYFAPNTTQGKVEALTRAATDPVGVSVISCSFGIFEHLPPVADLQQIDATCESAGLMGISVCVSSGDRGDGSGGGPNPRVRFPASSPNVLACGGTHAVIDGAGVPQETVWNEVFASMPFSSGGGVSGVFALPSWQASANVPGKTGGRTGRGLPDVAAKADIATGYPIRVRGFTFPMGGTSAAAPLWASLLARLNQNLGARVGHLPPLLYTPPFATALRDVTVGNNGTFFTAHPDWDACTGLGSPIGTALLKALS